jgi:ABC-type uncharacterized transport system ATPase subunit
MSGQVLELENVTKRCGDFTPVRDVSLTIPRRSLHGCLGRTELESGRRSA